MTVRLPSIKILALAIALFLGWETWAVENPGALLFENWLAPTHIGTLDGPLAGPGIWGQMLAGSGQDNLSLVGTAVEHHGGGLVRGGVVIVPTIPCRTGGYVQMIAWDGGLWGLDPQNVPPDQLGRTDIVRYTFGCPDIDPLSTPRFIQPAVVPIPEPSTLTLLGVGSVAMMAGFARRRQARSGASARYERLLMNNYNN